ERRWRPLLRSARGRRHDVRARAQLRVSGRVCQTRRRRRGELRGILRLSIEVMRELVLHQSNASGPLLPSRFGEAFTLLAKLGTTPRAAMRGQELRLAVALSTDDAACA